jgi:hypothetical protein
VNFQVRVAIGAVCNQIAEQNHSGVDDVALVIAAQRVRATGSRTLYDEINGEIITAKISSSPGRSARILK